MKLVISYLAFWMFIDCERVLSASLREAEKSVVKRDVDMIPAIFGGALDMTMDILDQFGKGFAASGSSKFDVDAIGLHDEKKFETGSVDVIQERKKRFASPCQKNETNLTSGTNNGVNKRNATNPDVETLARRKRSAQSDSYPTNSPPNGSPPNGAPPNGPPPNGPPPNGPPPNGPPPNGPPPNGPPPNGPPPNWMRPNGDAENGGQQSEKIQESTSLVREKRSPCRNATDLRSKRSPEIANEDLLPREENGNHKNAGPHYIEPKLLAREKRSPCNNATALRSKRSPEKPNNDLPPRERNGDQQERRPNQDHGQNTQNEHGNSNEGDSQNGNSNSRLKKRSAKPCNGNGVPNGNAGAPTNNFPSLQIPPQQQQQQLPSNGGVNIADLQRDQNQRQRRNVKDPDNVVPPSNDSDKNLFERIVEVVKEIASRVTRWSNDMANEETAAVTPKNPPK